MPLSRSPTPVDFESPEWHGRAAPARCALTRKLADTGDTALLDYHLAAMRDIGAPPLLTGNSAELLIDGPRTYRAMFAAIEKARDYVLIESFIFEEAAAQATGALSALLRARRRRAAYMSTCCTTRSGSLTTEAKFLDGLKQSRHFAVRLQSAESAR